MKKLSALILGTALVMSLFAGCSSKGQGDAEVGTTPENEPAVESAFDKNITVVSREDGSGTRGAFIEICGIEQKDEAGVKVDYTTVDAEIANSTGVVMTSVANNNTAIGYISLGSLNDTVKALEVNGIQATAENVKNGSYEVSRPFNIVKSPKATEAADEFISYILSAEGQAVVEEMGYVSVGEGQAFEAKGTEGKVVISGSSSVTPVMEKLAEAYKKVNANVQIEVQQSDSTTGMKSAIDGICDIGMASREIKDSEKEAGLEGIVIAKDGIGIVVNNENPTTAITMEQIKGVYTGEIKNWTELQ